MQIALLGSGMMGKAIAFDLAQNEKIDKILVCDIDISNAEEVAAFAKSDKVIPTWLDVRNPSGTKNAISGSNVIISAIHYQFNLQISRLAIEIGANFIDLGGNNKVVGEQLKLHEEAKSKGVTIIPDTGLAPGLVQILTSSGSSRFDELENVQLRVGGLPQKPEPPLNYKIVFSVDGLINEYIEDAVVIRNGKVQNVKALSEVEELSFPSPFEKLEAFQTSGGTSTLPLTYYGKVKNLDYKTIRYPGHSRLFQTLISLGFCSSEALQVDENKIVPRHLTGMLLEKALGRDEKDVVLVSVDFEGKKDGKSKHLKYRMMDYYDERTGLTAMMRSTGFSSSIIAQMLAEGKIEKKGVVPQEISVPPDVFMEELSRRNFSLEEIWE
ncbi:MAG: saccharopine dehydrogenase [candidate division Zixibacteria bacterium]|nr:saccharopine dehydrogenase [candidate division Zixibacteria bacterium]NIR68074.1 saccharopine dehydrogenase [candidate division Zixibacteria bacterium]NIS16858.1 saccharopine dehydrogenase [candidate division Zixibacteria bacterium]NIS49293.1 saccharopine dehydrogenase [candidate division Zixibacteria bacterium]NIT53260.1 saccharopine dehydrogenase [candidate division Zixibacteria bacterium]